METGDSLIFLLSAPRSGSTLLQRMLAQHADIHTGLESWLMLHPVYALREQGIWTEYSHHAARDALNHFLDDQESGGQIYLDAVRSYAGTLYSGALRDSGSRYFLDKTPAYTRIISELRELFPHARFVVLLRHPMALLNSAIETWLEGRWENIHWCRHDLLDALASIRRHVLDAPDFPGLVVRYEDLVTDPGVQMARIWDYLELPAPQGGGAVYEPPAVPADAAEGDWAMYYGDPGSIFTHDRPVDSYRDKWRALMRSPQGLHFARSYVEQLGQDTIAALGYDVNALADELDQAAAVVETANVGDIVPWELAIKPDQERTARERLMLERLSRVGRYGRFRGNIEHYRERWREEFRSRLARSRSGSA